MDGQITIHCNYIHIVPSTYAAIYSRMVTGSENLLLLWIHLQQIYFTYVHTYIIIIYSSQQFYTE